METHPTSPNSTPSSSSSSSCNGNNNNNNNNRNNNNNNNDTTPSVAINAPTAPISARLPTTAINPKPIESNPYPTTFVQADTSSFKQVVQMLTGSSATTTTTAAFAKHVAPLPTPKNTVLPPKRPAFKLYERRSGLKNLKTISPLAPPASRASNSAFSPRRRQQPEILSPSQLLDFPALALSPVTPLNPDPFNRSPHPNSAAAAAADEERAIAEKGFYLHPSPRGAEPPRLLPLFPMTSPRACPASAAATAAAGSFP